MKDNVRKSSLLSVQDADSSNEKVIFDDEITNQTNFSDRASNISDESNNIEDKSKSKRRSHLTHEKRSNSSYFAKFNERETKFIVDFTSDEDTNTTLPDYRILDMGVNVSKRVTPHELLVLPIEDSTTEEELQSASTSEAYAAKFPSATEQFKSWKVSETFYVPCNVVNVEKQITQLNE